MAWEAVAHFKQELDRRKSGEVDVHTRSAANKSNGHDAGGTPAPYVAGTLIAARRAPACVGAPAR